MISRNWGKQILTMTDTYIVRKCWKIGPHQHQNSYFPEKVPSQWKCSMAAQVRTENVIDWKKQYIMGMVMCLQLNGDQYPIKSFPQMWIFSLLWWRLAEAFHLIFWLNFYVALSWRFDQFYSSSFYNYLWKQPILRFSTQIPQTSMKCYTVQLAWREKSYGLAISQNSCTHEWKISNETCYHGGRKQEWHKKKNHSGGKFQTLKE